MDIRTVMVNGVEEEVIILQPCEQITWYDDCIQRVMSNARWYLDNLEFVSSFKVDWVNYGKNRNTCSKPKDL